MSSKYTIQADEVIFKNRYESKNITLKHNDTGFDLVFGSDVHFKYNTDVKTITIGDFEISLNESNSGILEISKNTVPLLRLRQ